MLISLGARFLFSQAGNMHIRPYDIAFRSVRSTKGGGARQSAPSRRRSGTAEPAGGGGGIRTRSRARACRVILAEEKGPEVDQGGLERRRPFSRGDRRFESPPLRQPVCLTGAFRDYRHQRTGFRRECEPGRDQRTGRGGLQPAGLRLFSLTGIDAVPPFGKTKTLNEKLPGLGLDTLYRGSPLNGSPAGCAGRSSRAADRVR